MSAPFTARTCIKCARAYKPKRDHQRLCKRCYVPRTRRVQWTSPRRAERAIATGGVVLLPGQEATR